MKVLIVFICLLVAAVHATLYIQPQQTHIALGEEAGSMTITWVTINKTSTSTAEYGLQGNLTMTTQGTQTLFVDGGPLKRSMYIHRVTLTNLKPLQTYWYHVGSTDGWSDLFMFKMPRSDPNWSPRFAVYGDMGNVNPQSLARLQKETQKGNFDAILHVGDMAYNLDDDNAMVGDAFMRQIEAVAAYVPYMVGPGNHENKYNFSNYKARFTMPKAGGDGESLWYSFDFGMAHIISFSSEVYFFTKPLIDGQRKWLEADLVKANANRAERPWIITMAHRPAYCSNSDHDDCTHHMSVIRTMLEDLLYKYGVDLQFWAHEHSYERLWPLYNYTVCNGTKSPYDNPPAPVHIITGSAGCQEKHDPFVETEPYFSAFRSLDYGYTHMTIHNATHLSMNQISDKNGTIVDTLMLIRDKHAAGMYTCHQQQDPKQEVLLAELMKHRKIAAAKRAGKPTDYL